MKNAPVVKLANTADLKSADESLVGSIPTGGTIKCECRVCSGDIAIAVTKCEKYLCSYCFDHLRRLKFCCGCRQENLDTTHARRLDNDATIVVGWDFAEGFNG